MTNTKKFTVKIMHVAQRILRPLTYKATDARGAAAKARDYLLTGGAYHEKYLAKIANSSSTYYIVKTVNEDDVKTFKPNEL